MEQVSESSPLLFTFEASRQAGAAIAAKLGIQPAALEETTFEDGERKLSPVTEVRGRDVLLVQSLHGGPLRSPHDKLCDVLQFTGALRDAGATAIHLLAPYLCYARADRHSRRGDPLALRYMAQWMEAAGISSVAAMDLHNPSAFENAFRIPVLNLEGASLFAEHFAKALADQEIRPVSPDIGGLKRAMRLKEALSLTMNQDVELTALGKRRLDHVVDAEEVPAGVRGCAAVIFDDLIATGATMLRAARACRKAGASYVIAAATHGLFLPGAEKLLEGELLDSLVLTDSIPLFRLNAAQIADKVVILSAADLLADGARRFAVPG
jgi:ribose-phosphate pyrophosphokinase